MKRVVGVVVWVALLVGVMLWPAVTYNWSTAATTYEETTIRTYLADFTVDDDGDLHAVETLVVDFPGFSKHGIFRFFDEADLSDTNACRIPHDISVTPGRLAPSRSPSSTSATAWITNVRIGDADVFVERGEHTYVIELPRSTACSRRAPRSTGRPSAPQSELEPDPQRLAAEPSTRHTSPSRCPSPPAVSCAPAALAQTAAARSGATAPSS